MTVGEFSTQFSLIETLSRRKLDREILYPKDTNVQNHLLTQNNIPFTPNLMDLPPKLTIF